MRALALTLAFLLPMSAWASEGWQGRLVEYRGETFQSNPRTQQFFKGLVIPGLVSNCCAEADCRQTKAEFIDGHWVAESRFWYDQGKPDEMVVIPDDRVTQRQSPFDAHAVICEGEVQGPSTVVLRTRPGGLIVFLYCFAPPPLGF